MKRVAAFIEPHWLIGRSGKPDCSMINAFNRAAAQEARIERVN